MMIIPFRVKTNCICGFILLLCAFSTQMANNTGTVDIWMPNQTKIKGGDLLDSPSTSLNTSNCRHKQLINYPNHKIFRVMGNQIQVGLDILVDYPFPIWMVADVDSNSQHIIDSYETLSGKIIQTPTNNTTEGEYSIMTYCNISIPGLEYCMLHRKIHGVIKIIQGTVSLLTMLPYILLWKFQNVPGWTQCSFFLALGLDCTFSGIYNFIYTNEMELRSTTFCKTTAAVIKIVEIACYSSWSIGHYDMLRIVWTCNRKVCKSRIECIRLAVYIFTGWGIPVSIVSCGFIWNYVFDIQSEHDVLQVALLNTTIPSNQRCLPPVTTSLSTFVIQMCFLVASIVFFATMAIVIRGHQNDTRVAAQSIEKRYGRQLKTFVKLTIFLGLPFVLVTILEICLGESFAGSWLIICTRLLLLGTVFYACFAFGYNRNNRILLQQKYPALRRLRC